MKLCFAISPFRHFARFALFLSLSVSANSFALQRSFSANLLPLSLDDILGFVSDTNVTDCSQKAEEKLCIEHFPYYDIYGDTQIKLNQVGDIEKLTFEVNNSAFAFNTLHLNLRKDRWQITKVETTTESFDVDEALSRHSQREADKALVTFINRTSGEFDRTFWFRLTKGEQSFKALLQTSQHKLNLTIYGQPVG